MKHLKNYAVFWIVVVILFNLLCFLTPSDWHGISKYSGGFWSGYAFVMVSFVLHFVYVYFAFTEKNREKRILSIPLTIISFFEFGLMIAAALLCMITPSLPYWVGIIVCYAILAFSLIFFVTAKAVGEKASAANIALNLKTSFMRELTDSAQELVSMSKTSEIKSVTSQVYEAIKYSDPVSVVETEAEEAAISNSIMELKAMLLGGCDMESFKHKVDDALVLIEKRNNKCRAMKRRV